MEKRNRIIIIGGGNSISKIDISNLHKKGYVIGVNDAVMYTKCHCALTMDRKWLEHRYKNVIEKDIPLYTRKDTNRNIKDMVYDKFYLYDCDHESNVLSDVEGILNGSNSGFVALNLAYQMNPKEIYLFGFDMKRTNNKGYWYKPYEWTKGESELSDPKYRSWGREFHNAKKQCDLAEIKVYNVNKDSALVAFQKIDFKEFERLTC